MQKEHPHIRRSLPLELLVTLSGSDFGYTRVVYYVQLWSGMLVHVQTVIVEFGILLEPKFDPNC